MQVIMSSKTVELTDGFTTFVMRKLQKLQKYTSTGLSHIHITVDGDRKRRGITEDTVVEMVGDVKERRIAVKEKGKTFYQAFFGALEKMNKQLSKHKEKITQK